MIASMVRRKGAIVAEYLQDRESYATVSMKQSFACGRGQDNSLILDTATTNHVFHQRSRFIAYKELDNPIEVRTGDTNCFVQGFGSVRLAIKTDKGPRSIRIDDIRHTPGFHTNNFAYKAFKKRDAYLDGRNNWIRKIKDNSCVAICENSPSESFLLQYAGDRLFQWVHIDLIHEEPGLSNKRHVFHFYCQKSKFNLAYVINDHKQKILVSCFAQAHGMIKKWSYDIQFVRMDQEAGLQSDFDAYCLINGIWQEKNTHRYQGT
ncbi:hypothetical protein GcM1_198042 [Golovinomyces cichoracearum]|uniref:Retrovirus-related Pol polyprotein from transposon TNT 1-94-like beta-barrel domain-containing protein n=1 Tax=Golovinomyces cichoracearum TaxID=62708 RepID=A0A420IZH6_9PEZI|nr:hypothetical protein GcM1_198042 [Golovinomyces cichoracearum]